MIDAATTLGDVITSNPGLAGELERRGLDYCCGGDRTLADACTDRGLDLDSTIDELRAAAVALDRRTPRWATMDVAELVDHLEATHHHYLWNELPRLSVLVDKIGGVHGDRHRELHVVADRFRELRADLEPHLSDEERVLFPAIRQMVISGGMPSAPLGADRRWIAAMLADHDRVGGLLAALRELTSGFQPPPDACASYRACYAGLAELEADTHLHVHKENNVLFPAVVLLEAQSGEGLA